MSDTGPREEDGDYAREFFDAYERQADEAGRRRYAAHVAVRDFLRRLPQTHLPREDES